MIRLMTPEDIPAGMRLKDAAGWNQTAQDWENVLTLEPTGCWVYELDGVVAGSTTAVCYGQDMAWIGMVLVLPEYRGQGVARKLMQHALRYLKERGVRCAKLDATDMGRSLYEQLGFVHELVIERWAGTAAGTSGEEDPPSISVDDMTAIGTLDRSAFEADRTVLLQQLIKTCPEDAVCLPGGYLAGRPGENEYFLGPCVAESESEARRLVAHFLARHAGKRVFWDLLPANQHAVSLARSFGFEPLRKLSRMARPLAGCPSGDVERVFAAAGFEYG